MHFNGMWKGAVAAVFSVSVIFWGGYTYRQLNAQERAQNEVRADVKDHRSRITTLEADRRAIKENLDDIKDSLKDISNDLKTRRY